MAVLHAAAGAFFSIGWFIFADGAWFAANRNNTKFEFVECLPGIFSMLAMILLLFVNLKAIQGGSGDDMFGGGGYSPEDTMRHKILFFFAAIVFLAGFTVAIWLQAAKYKSGDNYWPGLALLLQVVCFVASSCCIGGNSLKKPQDDGGF
jgi:O-antigen/teichoic acid export membrane protein